MARAELKEWVEIIKDGMQIFGLLLLGIYFFYRLLAGSFLPSRLGLDLVCETPFNNKRLVRCILKLKNTGTASLRVRDAWLYVLKVNPQPDEKHRVDWPNWPEPASVSRRPILLRLLRAVLRLWRGSQPVSPPPDPVVAYMTTERLDFQRLSFNKEGLQRRQASPVRKWLNLEVAGEQQRQFLLQLPPGHYKAEFRLVAEPLFGRRYRIARAISHAMFPLSRESQWIATAAIVVEEDPVGPLAAKDITIRVTS